MNKAQIDNSYLLDKIILREMALPNKNNIRILDCFSGEGIIWKSIKKRQNKNILITRIEKEKEKDKGDGNILRGECGKYLQTMDLSCYDMIDLDSYGIPFREMEIIFDRMYKGIVVVTYISVGMGAIPRGLLKKIGYTSKMVQKIPTLFFKKREKVLFEYLAMNGIKEITIKTENNKKNYLFFQKK